jgi:hypothetical protein
MTESYKPQGSVPGGVPGAAGLTDQAKTLGRDLKAKASELTDTVTQTAKDQMGEIGTAAKDMASDATGKVQSALNEQKTASADYLGTIANAVQRAAGEFESAVPQAAQYMRQTAGQIETVANAVRQRDMRELVGEVREFARRQPTLFFGGAVILGFAALRFLKSSATGSAGTSFGTSSADTSYRRAIPGDSSSNSSRSSSGNGTSSPRPGPGQYTPSRSY